MVTADELRVHVGVQSGLVSYCWENGDSRSERRGQNTGRKSGPLEPDRNEQTVEVSELRFINGLCVGVSVADRVECQAVFIELRSTLGRSLL